MTTFDSREKSVENKFAHDEEMAFKVTAKLNKLLGLWAAEKLGKAGSEAEAYAKDVVMAEFETSGDDVVTALLKDFGKAGLTTTAKEIRIEIERLTPIARKQIMGDSF